MSSLCVLQPDIIIVIYPIHLEFMNLPRPPPLQVISDQGLLTTKSSETSSPPHPLAGHYSEIEMIPLNHYSIIAHLIAILQPFPLS